MDAAVFIHTGFAVGGHMESCRPMHLDEICLRYPSLKVVAYHFGRLEHETLNALAWKHKNLYIGMSGTLGSWYYAPQRLVHQVGMVMNLFQGSEKLIFGTDWLAAPADLSVQALLNLEISEELQQGWGYPPITKQDLAKLLNLEVPARLQGIVSRRLGMRSCWTPIR